jgi:8-oxo-dGTP diphosphatase
MSEPIHVMAGALIDADGRVLIADRPAGKHQAGRWEFPGGKKHPAEVPGDGLRRELREELGIEVVDAEPLLQVRHDYPDRRVLIDCWRVTRWRGEPRPLDGQQLRWCDRDALQAADILEADAPIVTALCLAPLFVRAETPAQVRTRLARRPARRERIAWLLAERWSDAGGEALLTELAARGDLVLGIDRLLPEHAGVLLQSLAAWPSTVGDRQLVGVIVRDVAAAEAARARGAHFLGVLDPAVTGEEIARLARLNLPLYVDVSHARPGAPWSAAGKIWWPSSKS